MSSGNGFTVRGGTNYALLTHICAVPGTSRNPVFYMLSALGLTSMWVLSQWWTGRDLNAQPPECKSGALPLELPAHIRGSLKAYPGLRLANWRFLAFGEFVHFHKYITPITSFYVVEPAALHTLSVGFFLGLVTLHHILTHA